MAWAREYHEHDTGVPAAHIDKNTYLHLYVSSQGRLKGISSRLLTFITLHTYTYYLSSSLREEQRIAGTA